mgnify:CR=1 FL=1
MTRFLASVALVALLVLPPARAAEEEKVTLNFVNADIVSVIKAVGGHTGKNFILDPRVTTRSYGRDFLASLPTCTVMRGNTDVVAARTASWLA